MKLELDEFGDSGTGSGSTGGSPRRDRRQVDGEGNSLAPNAYGRLLARTVRIGGCAAFPIGACGVLVFCLAFSIGLSLYGILVKFDPRDVTPSVEGTSPRGTDIGDRDNTLHLMLFRDGGAQLYRDTDTCLGHSPHPDCSGLRRQLSAPTVDLNDRTSSVAKRTLRRAQAEPSGGSSQFCGAHGNGGCSKRQEVIFGARNGGNVLTAPNLVAMCAWEEKVHNWPSFQQHCEKSPASPSGCCFAPSLPRVIATMSNVRCQDLTPALVDAALEKLARCSAARDSGNGMPLDTECAALSALKITSGTDALTVVVGEGPGPDGIWDFPRTCGDFGARCRKRGNEAFDKGLVAQPFGEDGVLKAKWVASSLCLSNENDHSDSNNMHEGRDQAQLDYWFHVTVPEYENDSSPIIGLPNPHGLLIKINRHTISNDLQWAAFSFLLVYIYILISTRSLMVATFGMMHIFLSFSVTYAMYKIILDWYPFLLLLGLFVICGIGADDVFVFVDAWRQSAVLLPNDTSLESRISWVHRRASGAMFITSFTTAGAFLSNAVSPVIPICLFGIFMCMLVVINYLAVIGMFPSVVVLDHFLTQHRRKCCCSQGLFGPSVSTEGSPELNEAMHTVDHGGDMNILSPNDQVTEEHLSSVATESECDHCDSITTLEDDFKTVAQDLRPVERFFANVYAPQLAKSAKYFAAGCVALTAFVGAVFTSDLHKATTQLQIWPESYMPVVYDTAKAEGWPEIFTTNFGCEPECEDLLFVFGTLAADNGRKFDAKWPEGEEHMTFDRGHLVFDDDFSLASLEAQQWLLDFANSARQLPMFVPRAEENAVILPDDPQHPVIPPMVLEAAIADGPIWSADLAALLPLDPITCYEKCSMVVCFEDCSTQPDLAKALKLGGGCELGPDFASCFDNYVAAAAAGPTAAQRDAFSRLGISVPESITGVEVPFLTYNESGLRSIGIALHSTLDGREQGRWDYRTRSASWGLLDRFMKAQTRGVAFSYCSPTSLDIHEMWTCNGNAGDGFTENEAACSSAGDVAGQCEWLTLPGIGPAPPGLRNGWFHAPWFITTDLQETMVTAALESGAIAVVLAFVCLLSATRSLLMSTIALAAIVSALVLVIGCLVALGWKLGVLESMCMAISVGICVDFICHCAHAYAHAPPAATATRSDRVTHALTEMGISIVSAAVTTFTAAMVLALCTTVVFFTEFGIFLAVCMGCSLTVALAFFPAMLALVGPARESPP